MNSHWSQEATATSNALDLERGVFTWNDPERIARSLKHSADTSARRKSSSYHSAMSMLSFYMNRAGRKLPREQSRTLWEAKRRLRALYGRRSRA